jgi:hypothetical protein
LWQRQNTPCILYHGASPEEIQIDFSLSHVALSQCHLMGTPDVVNSALSVVDTRYVRLHVISHAATTLSPRLRTLCIRSFNTSSGVEELKAFMVALEDHHPDDAEPLQIHLQCETAWSTHHACMGVPFRWMPGNSSVIVTKEEHAHVEWMRLCAERLQPRGIDVLDNAGCAFDGARFELLEAELQGASPLSLNCMAF